MSFTDNLQIDVSGARAELMITVDGAPFRIMADFGVMAEGGGHIVQINLEDVDGAVSRIAATDAADWLRKILDGGEMGEAATGLAGRVMDAAAAASNVLRAFKGLR